MIVGIDASNIRAGGGLTHLVELLRAVDPTAWGFEKVIVWGSKPTLSRIEDRSWLTKKHLSLLDKGLAFRAFWQRFSLSNLAREEECDILLIPGGAYAGNFHPVVTMSRNLLPFEWRELTRYGLSRLTLKWLLLRWTQSASFRNSDGLIFLTQYAKQVVLGVTGLIGGQVAVIPHGVDSRFFCSPRLPRFIEECAESNPLRIVYVSIIDAYKHQWNVADAVAKLRLAGMPLAIDFVGPSYGPALKELERVLERVDPAQKFIRYLGAVSHDQVHHLYHMADICVFASSCENMPNILLEGMAAGLPIACSSRGPMEEILGAAGIYFDPEKIDEISKALQELILSPGLRAEKARLALDRSKIYSWSKCADETFEFLAKVAKIAN